MAELESVGYTPACCSWGLCRDMEFHWEWQVPIQHMPGGSGEKQHPCPSPGPGQGGSIQLLKNHRGKKREKRGRKGKCLQVDFITNQMENKLRATVLKASYPEGDTSDWKRLWDITGTDCFKSPLTPQGRRQEMTDLDPSIPVQQD